MFRYTLHIMMLSVCLYSMNTHSMEELTKEQDLQSQISRRKWFNVLHGAGILTVMALDVANSYWDENGLLTQEKFSKYHINPIGACECPNRTLECTIPHDRYEDYTCSPTFESKLLYLANNSTTAWRLYAGGMDLYYLYQVQQALNNLSVTTSEPCTSNAWAIVNGLNAGATGVTASIAGIVNGLKNYPRTIAVWGLNAALSAAGSFNWYKNMQACEEIMAIKK